jgi:asparagine synthase (glutamine-hydrolysing)
MSAPAPVRAEVTPYSPDSRWLRVDWGAGSASVAGSQSWRRNAHPACGNGEHWLEAGWHWDGTGLRVWSDRYGFIPLFVHQTPERVVVADGIDAMLAAGVPAELDYEALAVFLRTGFFLGDATAFRTMRCVPPASTLRISSNQTSRSDARPAPAAPFSGSRDDAIDEYVRRFRQAIAAALPPSGPNLVPLSGGRDSRHILLEIAAQARDELRALTIVPFPPKALDDVVVAAELCERLRIPHQVLPQPPFRLRAASERLKNRLTSYTTFFHAWYLPMRQAVGSGPAVLHDGIAGDVLSQSQYLSQRRLDAYLDGRYETVADSILGEEGYLPSALTRDTYIRCSREVARDLVIAELRRHHAAPNPIGQFYFWNRTRRAIAPAAFSLLPSDVTVSMPFLHPAVHDFLVTLPGHMLLSRTLHTETISRAFPEVADVPYETKRARDLTNASRYVRTYSALLLKETLHPGGGVLWRRAWLAPRALLSTLTGSRIDIDLIARLVLYLSQLEVLAARQSRA